MRILQYSQPRPLFHGAASSDMRPFTSLPKPATLPTDSIQLLKPGMKAGNSIKFSGWYHPEMSLDQMATACSNHPVDDPDFLGNTALILAARKNKPAAVKLLLEKNANINHQNQGKRTALMEAARKGYGGPVQLLLTHGANPLLRDAENQTAQDLAANDDIKEMIQAHPVNPQQEARSGEMPAPQQRGGWGGWIKKGGIIGLLLAYPGKYLVESGYDYKTGTTSLMKAAKSRNLEQARTLIEQQGANPFQKDVWGHTAQYYAEQAKNSQIIHYLETVRAQMINDMTHAAALNQKGKLHQFLAQGLDINAQDSNGSTALIQAVKAGNYDLVGFLLEQGANLRVPDNKNKIAVDYTKDPKMKSILKTAQKKLDLKLQNAINHNDVTAIQKAVMNGADPNSSLLDSTPLCHAANIDSITAIHTLIKLGADVDGVLPDGINAEMTAFMCAAKNENAGALKALAQAGADVNRQANGWTALHHAASKGHAEIIEELAQLGTKLQKEDISPLLHAVLFRHPKAIKTLVLHADADPNVRGQNDLTYLMVAAAMGDSEILTALLDVGAEVNLVDKDGYTALMHAADNGHEDIIQKLLKAGADPCYKTGNSLSSYDAYRVAKERKHEGATELLQKANEDHNCNNYSRFFKELLHTTLETAGFAYDKYQTAQGYYDMYRNVFG